MTFIVEHLVVFRRGDTFCDSSAAFIRLLQVDSKIKISDGEVKYHGQRTCGLQLSDGEIAAKNHRYFHLRFSWDGDPDTDPEALDRFNALRKAVRCTVSYAGGEAETLWDDLSAHYARRAYPKIYEIENLMRRLIAHFMLVKVGQEWAAKTLPKAVEKAISNSKRKNYLNVLDTVDFIHLGDILFDAYSKKTSQDLYDALENVKTKEDVERLQEFLPESNWKRYFDGLVTCQGDYLESRWKKLYELRCKVAHNALMTRADLDDIERLISEVKPKLDEAIGKLSKVKVPAEEAELVAENAARRINATIGEFINYWRQLESEVRLRMMAQGKPQKMVPSDNDLVRYGILDHSLIDLYAEVRQLRNSTVHDFGSGLSEEEIKTALPKLKKLLAFVRATGYVDFLRSLSEGERQAEVNAKIVATCHEIVESNEFNRAVAVTNASHFDIDDYTIDDIVFDDDECVMNLWFNASGVQIEDQVHCGNRVVGRCEAAINSRGLVDYRDVYVEVDDGEADGLGL